MNEEQTTPTPDAESRGRPRPSDGLSLADLRDVIRLRNDVTRLEDENRFIREQLSHAMSGWRDEQQRAKELEQTLTSLPLPASDDESPEEAPTDLPAPIAPARPVGEPPPLTESPGFWSRLWRSLSD